MHFPKKKRKAKLDPRAKVGIMVGFERGNSYKVCFPSEGKVVTSRDVTFEESNGMTLGSSQSAEKKSLPQNVDIFEDDQESATVLRELIQSKVDDDGETAKTGIEPEAGPEPAESRNSAQDELTHYPNLRRSKRCPKKTVRFGDTSIIALNVRMGNEDKSVPTTYKEAVHGPEKDQWSQSMADEIANIEGKETWKLVPLREGAKAIKNKWVYFKKRDSSHRICRFRARLVAKGFSQRFGIDYEETFAPVAKYSTLRLLLALATDEDLAMLQLDVKAAFLNGTLDEVIYMQQPAGFVNEKNKNWV